MVLLYPLDGAYRRPVNRNGLLALCATSHPWLFDKKPPPNGRGSYCSDPVDSLHQETQNDYCSQDIKGTPKNQGIIWIILDSPRNGLDVPVFRYFNHKTYTLIHI